MIGPTFATSLRFTVRPTHWAAGECQTGIGNLREVDAQFLQLFERLEPVQARVGDLRQIEIELNQICQTGETFEARVGDGIFAEIELLERRDSPQMLEAGVGHPRLTDAPKPRSVSPSG